MKSKLLFSVLFVSSLAVALNGQPELRKAKGFAPAQMGISDAAEIDRLMAFVPGADSTSRELLTDQSVKPFMMPVRRMGQRGTPISYALATCLEFYVNNNKNYKVNLSPDFISLSLRSLGQKVSLEEAFKFLVEYGTVNAAIVPYDADQISSSVYATPKYTILNYLHLFRPVTTGRQKTFEVRKALMRGNPVLIELKVDDAFKTLSNVDTWTPAPNTENSPYLYPLTVVSYDEDLKAFEVATAWGSNWGNSGYIWIKYDDFEKYALNGYVMIPEEHYPN